ncbi:hypothetical protein EGW08_013301 [Elysia chlorotica]|uniref:Uncharacterized protein n=1 Tax=Elysia chlorotica TaxID=188477 RepID=A0A433TBD8_ELYCH|nr:hypothetical protein EGW08_013301 [Elysia chlorotica]
MSIGAETPTACLTGCVGSRRSRQTAMPVSARTLTAVVMVMLLEHSHGARLTDAGLDCSGLICRQMQERQPEKLSNLQRAQLLKSRISGMYSEALGLNHPASGRSAGPPQTRDSAMAWYDLPGDTSVLTAHRPPPRHLRAPAKHLEELYSKLQDQTPHLKFTQPKRPTLSPNVSPEELDFSSNSMYQADELTKNEGKRQQGWHIQYGKRDVSKERDEPESDLEADLPSPRRGADSLARSIPLGDVLVPQEALDFLQLSKSLTYLQRERLERKLATLLQAIVRQGAVLHGEGQDTDGGVWLETSTPSYENAGSKHGGVAEDGDASYPGPKRAGALFQSHGDPSALKRQQGWHINYGKRDGDAEPFF